MRHHPSEGPARDTNKSLAMGQDSENETTKSSVG
jgi:hypothetical protein